MNEITFRLPRPQFNLMVALLSGHPYNQVADLLHLLHTQANGPPVPALLERPSEAGGGS